MTSLGNPPLSGSTRIFAHKLPSPFEAGCHNFAMTSIYWDMVAKPSKTTKKERIHVVSSASQNVYMIMCYLLSFYLCSRTTMCSNFCCVVNSMFLLHIVSIRDLAVKDEISIYTNREGLNDSSTY